MLEAEMARVKEQLAQSAIPRGNWLDEIFGVLEWLNSSPEAQRLHFRLTRLKPEERITTIITFEEQLRGWMSYLSQARSLTQQVAAYRRLKGVLDRYLKITVSESKHLAEAKMLDRQQALVGQHESKLAVG
jgi:hypothetical protein